MTRRSVWVRWVLANSLGELVGLGATFALGVGLFSGLAESPGAGPAVLSALLMTASGLLEGWVVGSAQWWAMRPAFPGVARRSWVLATTVGAVIAWFLGSIPMTVASLSTAGSEATGPEPPALLMVSLEVGLGLVAGLVLALPQWRVLRRHAARAGLWLPANSVAWGAGMPIVFAGVDLAQKVGSLGGAVAVMAGALLVAGAVVGAIHGAVLVFLAGQARTGTA
jgi:hypothetical protein